MTVDLVTPQHAIQPHQTILIVEDSEIDFEATLRALRKNGLGNPIMHCEDGDEALDFLYRRAEHKDSELERPAIILLDLNMPGTDGREVLEDIKANEELKNIPVIVLTTSTDERDINKCYEYGANSYVQKPVSMDGFLDAVRRIKEFWFEVAVFPRD